ncbi:MAG: sugar phosphate isomerase/epimerase [Acidobacteriia bacterium]|nr:sugar phosphate isomerase/epimerase [Terriglobia bacterium]
MVAMVAGGAFVRAQSKPLIFGFSLYGMKTLSWREGLGHVARIGYKATELSLRSGWDTEPKLLTPADRAEIRKRIGDLGLALPSVMENLGLARPGGSREANLERLRAAAEICHECSPGPPALIETTVGGRPDSWDELKNAMADELGAWAKKVEELKITLAIKAHSKTAMSRPERGLWLADQVKSPRVKLVYDYSHYAAFGLDLRKTMEQVVPRSVFVHIKDTIGTAPNHRFVLPGDGPVDLKAYAKNLIELGYKGPVVVEVSVDVFGQPGYDPVKAAEHVWEKVSPAFA